MNVVVHCCVMNVARFFFILNYLFYLFINQCREVGVFSWQLYFRYGILNINSVIENMAPCY